MDNKSTRLYGYLANIFIAFTLVSCQVGTVGEETVRERPNIIYILADDLGYGEVGAYGQTKIETPNIDALAKAGMLFTQHYTGAPVCAPARTVLLTGQHLGHAYIRGNDEWRQRGAVWDYRAMIRDSTLEGQRPLPKTTITLANRLQDAGYRTGMVGKWGMGAPHTHSIPTRMGFDYFFGYNCQRQAHTYHPVHLYENENRYYLNNDTVAPSVGLEAGADPYDSASYARFRQPDYAPEIAFEKLLSFLENQQESPFFLYWATPIPHLPLQAPKRWVDHYVQKFGAEEPYYYYEGEKGNYYPCRYPRATYAAMVSYLDENIGKLVAYLKREGLYDNTLILFSSDNGPSFTGGTDSPWFDSGGPFSSAYGRGKGFVYEGGIRVPMIASWPGQIAAGATTDHVSAFYDVLPTLCEIAKAKSPDEPDGISFLPTLAGTGKQQAHDYLYWEYPEYGGQVAVRMGDWKIIWKDIKKGNKVLELYQLAEDPAEENDLAGTHPEIAERLLEIIRAEHRTPEVERFRMEAVSHVANER